MQTHQLKRTHPNTKRMIVARGGKRGKTAGRGGKGQSARAGNKRRPEWRDIIKKLPKLRGRGVNQNKPVSTKPLVVNLSTLEGVFSAKDSITPVILIEKGVISTQSGVIPMVKILGDGEVTKAFMISGCTISGSAKEKIEKAGGTITALPSRILVKALTEAQTKKAAAPKKTKEEKAARAVIAKAAADAAKPAKKDKKATSKSDKKEKKDENVKSTKKPEDKAQVVKPSKK